MFDTSGSFCNDGSKSNEDFKKAIQINVRLTSKTTTLHMQHTSLFISFHFAVNAWLQSEIPSQSIIFMEDLNTAQKNFFLFHNLASVPKNSIPGKLTCIWHFKALEIITKTFKKWKTFL